MIGFSDLVITQGTVFVDNFADLPQVSDWFNRQLSEPRLQQHWQAAGQDLLLVIGSAFVGAFVLELVLLPLRRNLRRRKPTDVIRRLSAALSLLVVEMIPVIFFVVGALSLLNEFETQRLQRFVVLNAVYAITLNRLVKLLGRMLLAPRTPACGLFPITQTQARLYISLAQIFQLCFRLWLFLRRSCAIGARTGSGG